MKSPCSGVFLAVLCAFQAWAQPIQVETTTEQRQYLPGESIVLAVRITNFSGETLRLGTDLDWLTFSVEPVGSRQLVRQVSVPPVQGEFDLETGYKATKRVDLEPHFDLGQPGRYKVTATVRIGRWGAFTADPHYFDLVSGIVIWSREFGVPLKAGATNDVPEIRKYLLIQSRLHDVVQLYAKVTDISETKNFRLFSLGQLVSSGRPEQQTDARNYLHVLHQTGRATMTYSMVDPDGTLLVRRRYDIEETRPRLRPAPGGEITVVGGVRKESPYDVDLLAGPPAGTTPEEKKP